MPARGLGPRKMPARGLGPRKTPARGLGPRKSSPRSVTWKIVLGYDVKLPQKSCSPRPVAWKIVLGMTLNGPLRTWITGSLLSYDMGSRYQNSISSTRVIDQLGLWSFDLTTEFRAAAPRRLLRFHLRWRLGKINYLLVREGDVSQNRHKTFMSRIDIKCSITM